MGLGSNDSARRGLTRSEIVVILFACAVGLALLVPYVYRQRLLQRRTLCEKRQTDTATTIFAFENLDGRFPGYRNLFTPAESEAPIPTGWVKPILDLLGHDGKSLVPRLVCPDHPPPDPKQDITWMAWVVNSGLPDVPSDAGLPPDWPANGVFLDWVAAKENDNGHTSVEYLNRHDGAENTLLLSENVDAGRWTDSEEAQVAFVWTAGLVNGEPSPQGVVLRINKQRGKGDGSLLYARPASHHRGGVNTVFCDGSTRFLSEGIDYLVFCRLMTPDDANVKEAGSLKPLPPPYKMPKP